MDLFILSAVIVIISFFIIYTYWFHINWSRHNIPGPGLIESLLDFRHPLQLQKQKHYKKYGPVFGSYTPFGLDLYVNDPDMIKEVMVRHFDKFPDHRISFFGTTPIALNLFVLSSEMGWKRVRQVMAPTFTLAKLKEMMEPMAEVAERVTGQMAKFVDQTFDIKPMINGYTMDVLTACSYGVKTDSNSDPNNEMMVKGRHFFSLDVGFKIITAFVAPTIAKTLNRFIDFEPISTDIPNFFGSLTKRIIAERKKQPDSKQRKDFLQLMINAVEEAQDDNHRLSMDEMIGQCILFFVAGYDTTANTLSQGLHYLAKNPEIQQRLYQEIASLEIVNSETLANCSYLNAVINETLRLAPPFNLIERRCISEHKFDNGIYVPKNTTIVMLPYSVQRDEKYFPDPERFDPDRFLDGGSNHHPYAYIPFGGGPRLCLGMRFAMNQMRMFLAKMLMRYRFEPTDSNLDYFTGSFILVPKTVPVILKSRN